MNMTNIYPPHKQKEEDGEKKQSKSGVHNEEDEKRVAGRATTQMERHKIVTEYIVSQDSGSPFTLQIFTRTSN